MYKLSEKEYYLEQTIGPKGRVRSLDRMRGGYPIRSLGDKEYRFPDYKRDFFKEGGLIPG